MKKQQVVMVSTKEAYEAILNYHINKVQNDRAYAGMVFEGGVKPLGNLDQDRIATMYDELQLGEVILKDNPEIDTVLVQFAEHEYILTVSREDLEYNSTN